MNDNIEHLRYSINRFDHYYDSVNNKGAFFLSINTVLVGGYFALFLDYSNKVYVETCSTEGCLIGCFALCFCSIALTLWAILPFTGSTSDSNMFFGSIAMRTKEEFLSSIEQETAAMRLKDCAEQARFLAFGLKRKFELLSAAGIFLFANFLATLILAVSIISNLKPPTQ